MLVKFILRSPGEHREIRKGRMDAIPREGEVVAINDIARTVHSVTWDFDRKCVSVLLKE